jgi:tRNA(Ile2) C34 agmatinyltransferase TiaS
MTNKHKCKFCGNETECNVSGGFCSNSCKTNYRNTIRRKWRKIQREFHRKYIQ